MATEVADSGASSEVIGSKHIHQATNITDLDTPIKLHTAGGTKLVTQIGDLVVQGLMPMYRALIVPWSEISLVSIQDKIHKGWKWLGQDNTIQLTDQDNVRHTFKLQDDMFRYHETDSDARYACMGEAKKGKKVKQNALTGKSLKFLLATILGTLAMGPHVMDPAMHTLLEKLNASPMHKSHKLPHDNEHMHGVKGHFPHNPDCDACKRARFTARAGHRNQDPYYVEGSDKGYVLGIDIYGPFEPDLEGNTHSLIGVEVGRTDYTMVIQQSSVSKIQADKILVN